MIQWGPVSALHAGAPNFIPGTVYMFIWTLLGLSAESQSLLSVIFRTKKQWQKFITIILHLDHTWIFVQDCSSRLFSNEWEFEKSKVRVKESIGIKAFVLHIGNSGLVPSTTYIPLKISRSDSWAQLCVAPTNFC